MARYIGPSCRLCRAAGGKLFLKGDRCYTSKCAIDRRNSRPGASGANKIKRSKYAVQLIEKQKVKRIYGILEKQFYNYYLKASSKSGVTGDNLLATLERRLDNVVYRLGIAKSRSQARQLVIHGHMLIDGKRVDRPSFLVSKGDKISLSKDLELAKTNMKESKIPLWLEKNGDNFSVVELPTRESAGSDINDKLVVEFYSR